MRALPALLLATMASACGTEERDQRDGGADTTAGPRDERTFAVSFFRLGFSTRDGENTSDAWKKYGFNLDGVCTTTDDSQASKNTCKRADGSSGDILTDGDDCIDNNFGSQLVTLIKAIDPQAEVKIADGITKGSLTLIFRITDLAESGADESAPAALFAAKAATGFANLDGNDVFDIDSISVAGGDVNKPIANLKGNVTLENGSRVWHGTAETLDLPAVFIAGATGAIPIRGARVTIDLDTGRGTIAGYAPTTRVQSVVSGVLGQQKLCPGSGLYENILKNIERAADMPAQLPHDPAQTCASLSLGLGVEVVGGSIGKVVPSAPPPADPCKPDAGPDARDATVDAPEPSVDADANEADATDADATDADATDADATGADATDADATEADAADTSVADAVDGD